MIKEMTVAEQNFYNFIKLYFNISKIRYHLEYFINSKEECHIVRPDFTIIDGYKFLFEFKELQESQVRNSPRDTLISWFDEPIDSSNSTRFLPNVAHKYIIKALRDASKQLSPALELRCPSVVIIHTRHRGLQLMYNKKNFIEFTTAMYGDAVRFNNHTSFMSRHDHISALAYFSAVRCMNRKIGYRIRFYHNYFAKYPLPIKPFNDTRCQHYFIKNGLFWHPTLNHIEGMG